MIRVTLESDSEVLDLDEISMNGEGVEVIAGLTGFGLPPVEVSWLEGGGDGATYRSHRVLPRELDLPLHVYAFSREALKKKVATIARIFSSRVRIRVYDTDDGSGPYLYSDFYRVGGGTYSYGTDTSGEQEWSTTITIRSGSPFWIHSASQTQVFYKWTNNNTAGTMSIANPGTASSKPVWTLHGPMTKAVFDLDGLGFEWNGNLLDGQTLTIDTARLTVTDGAGNAYAQISPAPTFFEIPASDTPVAISIYHPAVGSANTVPGVTLSYVPRDWMVI